jgi:hypothetical protein
MKNISRNYLLKTLLIASISFGLISFKLIASDLTVIKYGYGLRGRDSSKYEKIAIHSFDYDPINNSIFSLQNILRNNKFNASVVLSVTQKDSNVIATVNIKNSGSETFYIKYIEPGPLITTGNILLDYLGPLIDYRGDFEKQEWVEFLPGKVLSSTSIVNHDHEFFPSKIYYNLVTEEYILVNDKWFLERGIYSYLFSILDMGIYDCDLNDNPIYVYLERFLCTSHYYKDNEIQSLFNRLNFDGINKDNMFTIRSNQVNVEIDGSKVKSLYEK